MFAATNFSKEDFACLIDGLLQQLDRQGSVCVMKLRPMDMEDIMQSMLLEHFEAESKKKEMPDALESLMHALATNDLLRTATRDINYDALANRLSTNILDTRLRAIALEEILKDALSVNQFNVTYARYIRGLTVEEIAEDRGILPSQIAVLGEGARQNYVTQTLEKSLAILDQPKYRKAIKG